MGFEVGSDKLPTCSPPLGGVLYCVNFKILIDFLHYLEMWSDQRSTEEWSKGMEAGESFRWRQDEGTS